MKKLLIASLVVVSLLLLASGAMADRGDRHGGYCPEEKECAPECPPEEVCPTIEVCFPEMPVCDIDVCFPEAPCCPKIVMEEFPEIICPEISCDFPEICCPCPIEKPCPEPEPCPPAEDECNNCREDRHHRR
jgi:hypothetical protein